MKVKKLLAVMLTVVMALAVLPVAAMAEDIGYRAHESYMLGMFDEVWEKLDRVEAEALASGASSAEVTMAVYRAALVNELVDEGSVGDLDAEGFSFRVSGMLGGYNYKSRNVRFESNLNEEVLDAVVQANSARNGNSSLNVLLIGPYYGYDSSFTNQYRQEVESLAAYTQGELTKIEGHAATGPAIAAAEPNAGVIIYDSHGTAMSGTSYLCLTTNSGLTSTDFSNGWAYNGGSSDAGIDGRYIQNHIEGQLPNSFIWMAICEGMKLSGHGVTGNALLAAGAGVVYGYSQSVTFAGDYVYEATFWNHMKQGETTAEALVAMKTAHGIPDPYGDAYPIAMSAEDPFPANPDGPQTVNTDWRLYQPSDLVVTDAVSLRFDQASYGVAPTFTVKLEPVINPEGANNFTSTWTSSNPNVATVNKKGVVTGVTNGTATITLTIASTEYSNSEYTYTASAQVTVSNEYLPVECMYVPVDNIVPGERYLIGTAINGNSTYVMGNQYYDQNHQRTLTAGIMTLTKVQDVACIVDGVTEGQEWIFSAANGGTIRSAQTGAYLNLTDNYLTIGSDRVAWSWEPSGDSTTGVMTNNVNANFKYLCANNSNAFFSVFLTSAPLQLFRKLTRQPASSVLIGDANFDGVLAFADVAVLYSMIMTGGSLTPEQQYVLDVNGDGSVSFADVSALYNYVLSGAE